MKKKELKKIKKKQTILNSTALTLRIPNSEVNENFSGVCEYIDDYVKQSLGQLSSDKSVCAEQK